MIASLAALGGGAIPMLALPALWRMSWPYALLFATLGVIQLGGAVAVLARPVRQRVRLAAIAALAAAALIPVLALVLAATVVGLAASSDSSAGLFVRGVREQAPLLPLIISTLQDAALLGAAALLGETVRSRRRRLAEAQDRLRRAETEREREAEELDSTRSTNWSPWRAARAARRGGGDG